MSKQTMTKSQLREAINGLGPLAPDWLVEALEDFIELQEAHKNLLAIHAEDAYHLDEARAKLQAPAIDERAEFEKWFNDVEMGDGTIAPPKNASDPRWDDYVMRHQAALGGFDEGLRVARAKLAHDCACATQPANDEPVGVARTNAMLKQGDTFCVFELGSVPEGTKLYTRPPKQEQSPKVAPTVAIDERAEFEKWWRHFENARNVSLFDVWQAARKLSAPVVPDEIAQLKEHREYLLVVMASLACLGNGHQYGNSEGNKIAQNAIVKVNREIRDYRAAMLKGEK